MPENMYGGHNCAEGKTKYTSVCKYTNNTSENKLLSNNSFLDGLRKYVSDKNCQMATLLLASIFVFNTKIMLMLLY